MKAKNKVQKDKRRDLLRAQEIFLKMNGPTKIDGQVKVDIANKKSGNGAFIVEGNAGNNPANDNDQSKSTVGKEAKAQVDRNAGVEQAVRRVTFGLAGDPATGEEEIFAAVVAGDNSQADAVQSLNAPSANVKAGVSFKTLPTAMSEDNREVNSRKVRKNAITSMLSPTCRSPPLVISIVRKGERSPTYVRRRKFTL